MHTYNPEQLNKLVEAGIRSGETVHYKGLDLHVLEEQRYALGNTSVRYFEHTDVPHLKNRFIQEILRHKFSEAQRWSGRVVCTMAAGWPKYYQEFPGTPAVHCTVVDKYLPAFLHCADNWGEESSEQVNAKSTFIVGDVLNVPWEDMLCGDEIVDLTNIGDHVEEFADNLDGFLNNVLRMALCVYPQDNCTMDFVLTSKWGKDKLDEYFQLLAQKIREYNLPLKMRWLENETLGIPNMKVPADEEKISQFLVLRFSYQQPAEA
jgi:hypothetical protein